MGTRTALGPTLAPDPVEQRPATDAPCACTMAAADSTMTPEEIRDEVKSIHVTVDDLRSEVGPEEV